MKRKGLWVRCFLPLMAITLIVALIAAGCAPGAPEVTKEKIKVGFGACISGIYAPSVETILNPYTLWAEQVNAKGGLYVKDIGKSLPVELVYYDDRSSAEEEIKIYERLINVDKVDLVLPPWGTEPTTPIIPMAEKYRFPLLGATCGDEKLLGMDLNYFWMLPGGSLGQRNMPTLVSLFSAYKNEIQKVGGLYVHFPIALENEAYMRSSLEAEGFEIVLYKDYPMGIQDMSGPILEMKRQNADALIALCDPASMFLIIQQSRELGFDPKFAYFLIGTGISPFFNIVGEAAEGLTGMGYWSREGPGPGSTEFFDSYVDRFGITPDYTDACLHWAVTEILEQAVEKAGTLDWEKLKEVIDTETFTTIMGPVKYDPATNTNFEGIHQTGGIAQAQGGMMELIWPPEYASAEPIIPKPSWSK